MNNKRHIAPTRRRGMRRGVHHRTIIVFESRTIEPKLVDLTSKHSFAYVYVYARARVCVQRCKTKLADAFFVTHSFRVVDFTAGYCCGTAARNAQTRPRWWSIRRDGIQERRRRTHRGNYRQASPIRLNSRASLGAFIALDRTRPR